MEKQIKALELAIELSEKLIELKKVNIPEYKKVHTLEDYNYNNIIIIDNKEYILQSVVRKPNGIETWHLEILIKPNSLQELWDKVKPKEAIEELEKTFKEQNLKKIDKQLADLEITKDSILAMKDLIEKGLI